MRRFSLRSASQVLALTALAAPAGLGACSSGPSSAPPSGQTDFVSAPFEGQTGGGATFGAIAGLSNASAPAAPAAGGASKSSTPTRTVQETDLYRLEGNRLYYLNSYRGLMVFDVTNVDQPRLLGRSAIYGTPVDMIVNSGIATVVVGDWYGTLDDGSPFHGSIVRGLDATDPTNIKVVGDAKLGGWVQEDRVVGNVLYAVSEDYGWSYGWEAGGAVPGGGGIAIAPVGGSSGGPSVIVSSVSFGGGQVKPVTSKTYAGYGGVFNVTPKAIMLAHPDVPATDGGYVQPTKTDLVYLDISDPGGKIVQRGTLQVDGVVNTNGADEGRWGLDFADGRFAHVIGCASGQYGCGGATGAYVLATGDFLSPDAPTLANELSIPATGWSVTARFDTQRMYLSPNTDSYAGTTTPLQVYDLSNPAAPTLAGHTELPGTVWLMVPSGHQLFALGSDGMQTSSPVALNYLDVTNAASPTLVGTSTFGDGWASTPATGTFKAFTMDPTRGLVVLPFSGWDAANSAYNNGVQLIEFTPTSITTAGAAHTTGWVERGIFVNNRIVSLSDLALSVVDYSNPLAPKVTASLTLARSVVTAQPSGSTIAEISSDWWSNDVTHSDVRVLPVTDSEENRDESKAVDTPVAGVDANVFTNGSLDYIVTNVQVTVPCTKGTVGSAGAAPSGPASPGLPIKSAPQCSGWEQQVQVVDLSGGGAKLRGKIALPMNPSGGEVGWGWYGCYDYDWFNGADVVQVNGSTLAFRRWNPQYVTNGSSVTWDDASSDLFVVDLSNPDAPTVASTVITNDPTGWWGNMRVVGSTLYTSHYEWTDAAGTKDAKGIKGADGGTPIATTPPAQRTARYYLDRIDLGDVKHPTIGSKINVPGALVGGSQSDPSVLYTIDYGWDSETTRDFLDVVKIYGDLAYLQSMTPIDGYVGNVIVRGNTAYMTAQVYSDKLKPGQPRMELHQIDLSNPRVPVDRVASGPQGWGWLLDVEGDRAMVTSGWSGGDGLDIYRLSAKAGPAYDQFVRTRGWSVNSLARQGNQLFLSSGYWGVQAVTLQ
jgi:hypothetical protein